MITVELVGGQADGLTLQYEKDLPPKIFVPVYPHWGIGYYGEQRLVVFQSVYQRVGDTTNYICISEPKGE